MKNSDCEHYWERNFCSFRNEVIEDLDSIGLPVICKKCGTKGIEWWIYSRVDEE